MWHISSRGNRESVDWKSSTSSRKFPADLPYYFLKDHFKPTEDFSPSSLAKNEGGVFTIKGKKAALEFFLGGGFLRPEAIMSW